jgi:hypothetical protein
VNSGVLYLFATALPVTVIAAYFRFVGTADPQTGQVRRVSRSAITNSEK